MSNKDEMPALRQWSAKRSGGRITIYHEAGKVGGIDTIETSGGGAHTIIATHFSGKKYRLIVG